MFKAGVQPSDSQSASDAKDSQDSQEISNDKNTPNSPVKDDKQNTSNLQINMTKYSMIKGNTSSQLRAYFSDDRKHTIKVKSSDPSVVKIDRGNSIIGVSGGKAVVTFTSDVQSRGDSYHHGTGHPKSA